MDKEMLFKNYKKSLEQKYNAVCFDIDGTITQLRTKKIDVRAVKMIANLLIKKIPVVFITGRGETGLNDLKNDIFDYLKGNYKISEEDMKRIYVLTNDGARLFFSDSVSKETFLTKNIYISTKEELNHLDEIGEIIKKIKSVFFDISYSRDLKDSTILNIRIVFNTPDIKIIDNVFNDLITFINNKNFNDVFLTRGIYKDKIVIQIGTAKKDKAIEKTEKIIGIPQNSMMRIGDCGDVKGNDYSMLNCAQGYSVDKISGSMNSCFPIFDEDKNVLTGVDATLQLIKSAKILPTVCLEKADKEDYSYNFAKVEQSIVLGRKKLLNKYNNNINNNFNTIYGIDSIFDKFSGSVIVPMFEWKLLENNSLKEFWAKTENSKMMYSMRDDNNYLLRGSNTYYYFLANRISLNGKDNTTKEIVISWYENYINFVVESFNAIYLTKNLNEQVNKKLVLGILDNYRNLLLILLNHNLLLNSLNNNILLDISNEVNKDLYMLTECLLKVENIISSICFKEKYLISKDELLEISKMTEQIVKANYHSELLSDTKDDYSKDYRAYREIDNFAENYIAVSIYNEKTNDNTIINSCGLSYGGIELPIISKIIKKNKVEQLLLLKFNKEVSGYSNKQNLDLRNFNINEFGGIKGVQELLNSNVDLFDDNVLTGKTLQIAINSLYDYEVNVNNICIVRYPGINRIDQMFHIDTSAIDYHLFFNYIYGLCFSSPYSWKDDEWIKTNGKYDYTDSLGVFDLNRKKIIECLIKNHDFKENSEVEEYRRRLSK